MIKIKITLARRALLLHLLNGGYYVEGPQVSVARALEGAGLVTLEDNGAMVSGGRYIDNERWTAELTEAGKAQAAALEPPTRITCPHCEHEWDGNKEPADQPCPDCGASDDGDSRAVHQEAESRPS